MDCVFKGPSKDDPITNDPSVPWYYGIAVLTAIILIGIIASIYKMCRK